MALDLRNYDDYRYVWTRLNRFERAAVTEKARREGMTPWAVLREWPTMIPRRFRDRDVLCRPQGLTG